MPHVNVHEHDQATSAAGQPGVDGVFTARTTCPLHTNTHAHTHHVPPVHAHAHTCILCVYTHTHTRTHTRFFTRTHALLLRVYAKVVRTHTRIAEKQCMLARTHALLLRVYTHSTHSHTHAHTHAHSHCFSHARTHALLSTHKRTRTPALLFRSQPVKPTFRDLHRCQPSLGTP
jgi:hypothetical protein